MTIRFVLALLALAPLAACGEDAPPPVKADKPCPALMTAQAALKPGESLACLCDGSQSRFSVRGTDRYEMDSSPCLAAVHAGILKKHDGGAVRIFVAEGCPHYKGSSRHGIGAADWPRATPKSFAFKSPPPACPG